MVFHHFTNPYPRVHGKCISSRLVGALLLAVRILMSSSYITTNLILADHSPPNVHNSSQPYSTLVQAFSPYGPIEHDQFQPLLTLLERISIPAGTILWRQNDPPDGLYIVESGVLRAMYSFGEHTLKAEESMVPGTIAGELSALSELPRNATCVVERNAVVWKLSTEGMRKLEREEPELARMFMQMVLKGTCIFDRCDLVLTSCS